MVSLPSLPSLWEEKAGYGVGMDDILPYHFWTPVQKMKSPAPNQEKGLTVLGSLQAHHKEEMLHGQEIGRG